MRKQHYFTVLSMYNGIMRLCARRVWRV